MCDVAKVPDEVRVGGVVGGGGDVVAACVGGRGSVGGH